MRNQTSTYLVFDVVKLGGDLEELITPHPTILVEFVVAIVYGATHIGAQLPSHVYTRVMLLIEGSLDQASSLMCDDLLCLGLAQAHCELLTLTHGVLCGRCNNKKKLLEATCSGWLLTLHETLQFVFWWGCG